MSDPHSGLTLNQTDKVSHLLPQQAAKGQHAWVQQYMSLAHDPTVMDQGLGMNALHAAVHHRHNPIVHTLLSHGYPIDRTAAEKWHNCTALHFAVATGCMDLVRILIDHGADLNRKTCRAGSQSGGWSPLSIAHAHGHDHLYDLLTHFGAEHRRGIWWPGKGQPPV